MEQLDIGSRNDLIEHRFRIAQEDPRSMGRRIVKAEEIRHASDYDTFYIASKDITKQQVETAELLLQLAKEFYANNE